MVSLCDFDKRGVNVFASGPTLLNWEIPQVRREPFPSPFFIFGNHSQKGRVFKRKTILFAVNFKSVEFLTEDFFFLR